MPQPDPAPTAPKPPRGQRRRQQTRAKLVGAALAVMARKGVAATTIQEITDEADVGFGSFYNHFPSKEAIVAAVMDEHIERLGDALDQVQTRVDDPAEVLSVSIRLTLRKVQSDPQWGWFLIRAGLGGDPLQLGIVRRMARDIAAAARAGRGSSSDVDGVITATSGALFACIGSTLTGRMKRGVPERCAALALRLLGLPPDEAEAVAHRRLPRIALP
jgi:AcrR family transcriptional regulator